MSSYGMGGDVFIPTQLSCVLAEGRQEGDYESNSNDGGSGVAALSKNDKVYHNRSQEMESFGAPRSMGGTDLPAKLFRYRTQNHRLDHMPYETEKGEMGLDQDGESREQTTYPPIGCDTRKQFILAQDCNDVHRGKLKKKVEGEDTDCSEENNQPWENILYKRQRYPDNFVPDTFLEKLVTNAYIREPDLRLYVVNSFAVTQQISAVASFLAIFMRMQDCLISAESMVVVDLVLLFGGCATMFLVSATRSGVGNPSSPASPSSKGDKLAALAESVEPAIDAASLLEGKAFGGPALSSAWSHLFSIFLFLAVLSNGCVALGRFLSILHVTVNFPRHSETVALARRVMAPVLRTLTVSYSTDTIYALAISCGFLHLAFHDYSFANTASGRFQGTLSLNAAIFAAVLLASRLESNEKVFGLVLFALELFALFPLARREVKRHSLLLHASVTSAMVIPTGFLLYTRHFTLFITYVATVLLVTLACPLWLLRVQRYKLRIEGPWDIAHVQAEQ